MASAFKGLCATELPCSRFTSTCWQLGDLFILHSCDTTARDTALSFSQAANVIPDVLRHLIQIAGTMLFAPRVTNPT